MQVWPMLVMCAFKHVAAELHHVLMHGCRVIGEALQQEGSDAHPSDYLNFYAVANRQKSADPDLKRNSGAEKAGASPNKSFIHVHAKVTWQCIAHGHAMLWSVLCASCNCLAVAGWVLSHPLQDCGMSKPLAYCLHLLPTTLWCYRGVQRRRCNC